MLVFRERVECLPLKFGSSDFIGMYKVKCLGMGG